MCDKCVYVQHGSMCDTPGIRRVYVYVPRGRPHEERVCATRTVRATCMYNMRVNATCTVRATDATCNTNAINRGTTRMCVLHVCAACIIPATGAVSAIYAAGTIFRNRWQQEQQLQYVCNVGKHSKAKAACNASKASKQARKAKPGKRASPRKQEVATQTDDNKKHTHYKTDDKRHQTRPFWPLPGGAHHVHAMKCEITK